MRILGYSVTRRRRKFARGRVDTRRVIRDFLHTLERLAQQAGAAAHADA